MTPLQHIRVLDLTRLAPGPHCTMMLADLGADVLRVEEAGPPTGRRAEQGGGSTIDPRALGFLDAHSPHNPLHRGKRSMGLNLKSDPGRDVFRKLASGADIVVEEFRPGVAKRLGIDYESLRPLNGRLIYCAITGYGQDGPYAERAGHDINYLSLCGLLGVMGPAGGPPAVPQNLVADYAGGALQAVIGILAALIARQQTGRGQFVDVSMTEGAMSLLGSSIGFYLAQGRRAERGRGLLDGGAPFYGVYGTSDGRWLAVGAIEPWFFANLCKALGHPQFVGGQFDQERWPAMRQAFADTFRGRTRDEWCERFAGTDTCVTPVLGYGELEADPQHRARSVFVKVAGTTQVAPTPRLSQTPARTTTPAPIPFQHTDQVLHELGYDATAIAQMRSVGAIR